VPKDFWHMAVLIARNLINRTPSQVLGGKAPLQVLHPDHTMFLIISRSLKYLGVLALFRIQILLVLNLMIKLFAIFFRAILLCLKDMCYDPVSKHFYHSIDVLFSKMFPFFFFCSSSPF
jgi:hypothetical protein